MVHNLCDKCRRPPNEAGKLYAVRVSKNKRKYLCIKCRENAGVKHLIKEKSVVLWFR
jgi:hypothetical protein